MVQCTRFDGLQTTYEQAAKLRDHGYPRPTYKAGRPALFYEEPSEAYGPLVNELIDENSRNKRISQLRTRDNRSLVCTVDFGQTRLGLVNS